MQGSSEKHARYLIHFSIWKKTAQELPGYYAAKVGLDFVPFVGMEFWTDICRMTVTNVSYHSQDRKFFVQCDIIEASISDDSEDRDATDAEIDQDLKKFEESHP